MQTLRISRPFRVPRIPRTVAVGAFAVALVASGITATAAGGAASMVDLQFVNVSDWHAQLDPLVVGTTQIGGAAVLSTYFKQERQANPNTITLTAGDAYGASPPLSGFFNEVPAIRAMNLMGFNVDTFGNHNFDGGTAKLQQKVDLAEFPYVSANLTNRDANLTGVQDFVIIEVGGVKVGIVGITNPEAPTLVFPGNFGTIVPSDPVPAANKARAAAQRAGAKVVVAITHMGISGVDPATGLAFGPLIDFADTVGGFDVIFGDHTDFEYSGTHGKALVIENRSKGRTYARTKLAVDARNGRVAAKSVEFVTPLSAAVTPDPAVVAMVDSYRVQLAPILGIVVGSSSVAVPRTDSCGRADGRLCESLVGDVTTDAMRIRYGTDFAFTNSGGLRAALTCPAGGGGGGFCPVSTPPPFVITRGQVLSVLPFGNIAVTLTINGAEVKQMLENGVSAMPGANGKFAQVSGLCFSYNVAAAVGSRVTAVVRQAANGSCSGPAVDLTAASSYTVAINDFMATGGDGYPVVFSRSVTRELLHQVLADYVAANPGLAPTIQGRIACSGIGCPATLP